MAHFVFCYVLAKMEIVGRTLFEKISSGDCRLKGLGHKMYGLLLSMPT
jgi:hypothetical protein